MSNEINQEGSLNISVQGVQNSTVNITQLLGKSAQYQDMLDQLNTLEKLFSRITEQEAEERVELSQKINQQKQVIEQFRRDVLQLAEQFNRIEINTDRLRRAKEFFDKGEFDEARAVLEMELEQMQDEQARLLAKREEYETGTLPKLKSNSEEFFILAMSTRSHYANPNWFADSCEYFERSIKSDANQENVFGYAVFLQNHNKFTEAERYYQQLLTGLVSEMPRFMKAMTLNNLAVLHKAKNEYGPALKEYEEALTIHRRLAEANPAAYLPYVATTLNNLAILHSDKNEYESALGEYEEALAIRRELARVNPATYLPDVAMTLINHSIFYLRDQTNREKSIEDAVEVIMIVSPIADKVPFCSGPLDWHS